VTVNRDAINFDRESTARKAWAIWYVDNCRLLIPAENEIKVLMRRAYEAGYAAGYHENCKCGRAVNRDSVNLDQDSE
jgi:hypothetical protein